MRGRRMTGEARDYMVAPGLCFKIIHEEDTLTYPGPNRFFMDLYNPQKKEWVSIGAAKTREKAFEIFCTLAGVPYRNLEETRVKDYFLNHDPETSNTGAIKITCFGKERRFNTSKEAISYLLEGKEYCGFSNDRIYGYFMFLLNKGVTEVSEEDYKRYCQNYKMKFDK